VQSTPAAPAPASPTADVSREFRHSAATLTEAPLETEARAALQKDIAIYFQSAGEQLTAIAAPVLAGQNLSTDFILPQSIGAETYHPVESTAHDMLRGSLRTFIRSFGEQHNVIFDEEALTLHIERLLERLWHDYRTDYKNKMEADNIPSEKHDLSLPQNEGGQVKSITINYRMKNLRNKEFDLETAPTPDYKM
jgi:hypothetical protein